MIGMGAPDPYLDPALYPVDLQDPADPDPAGSYIAGSGSDLAGSEVASGKCWPDIHNYDIIHHSIFSFQEMTHDSTELYTKTHYLSHFSSDINYH